MTTESRDKELESIVRNVAKQVSDVRDEVSEVVQKINTFETPEVHIAAFEVRSEEKVSESKEALSGVKEPTPIVIPPPPPFFVKVIPDNLIQDSFMFKYGVLAKWHVKEELANTSSHLPYYTKAQRKIQVCEYGGESAKKGGHAKRTRSLYERSTLAKCFKRSCPKRTRLDEWVEGWSVHSGRFKLLT